MISNQVLQSTIDGLKAITRRDFTITDTEAKVLASTEDRQISLYQSIIEDFVNSQAESQLIQGYHYFKVFDDNVAEYIVSIKGEDEEAYRIGKIAAFQIQNLLVAYKERYDKDNFIKNLLLDNMLLIDIYSKAKKLNIENNVTRVVYLIDTQPDKDINYVEIVRSIFPAKSKDFVTAVDERSVILVKEITEKEHREDKEKIARMIYDTISGEAMTRVSVAVGTFVEDLKDVSRSYKEAKMALEVGKIFYSEKNIISYDKLGIGRLIYQLPVPLCHMYVNEVLQGRSISEFDEETLTTVNKFFENNLNVSETSRQLYIHRNTLVYRLDKLQKMTGLDLRNFEDAITFKITLMVSKYMNYVEKTSY